MTEYSGEVEDRDIFLRRFSSEYSRGAEGRNIGKENGGIFGRSGRSGYFFEKV